MKGRLSLSSILLFVIVALLSTRTEGFYQSSYIHGLSRSNPLQTAGDKRSGRPIIISTSSASIPRLEPGLRILRKSTISLIPTESVRISTFSLDWLKEFEQFNEAETTTVDPRIELGNMIRRIVGEVFQHFDRVRQQLFGAMKRLATAVMIFASSLSSSPFLPAMGGGSQLLRRLSLSATSVIATVAAGPTMIARAGAIKKYSDLSPTQKLATTPLYFVSSKRGNAYLQEDIQAGRPEQKIITYFMSSEDAMEYLNEMAQVNSQSSNEFRIMTTSMEKIVNQIQSRKQSRKLGRYEMDMVYRIQPSSRQCENAEVVAGKGNRLKGSKALRGVSIPMFSAQGMAMKRSGTGEVLTPYYFAYEDLLEDWERMAASSSSTIAPSEPKVQVKDFTDVMCLCQGITQDSIAHMKAGKSKQTIARERAEERQSSPSAVAEQTLRNPGIVPPRREIEMIRRYYRNQAGMKNEFSKAKYLGAPR